MPTTDNSNIDALILDYLDHEIDDARAAVLREWISASPDNAEHFLRTQDIWLASTALPQASRFDPDRAYERMMRRADAHKRRRRAWICGAVGSVAAALLCFVTYEMGESQGAVRQEAAVVYADASGSSAVTLPDGTRVELNKGSELRFSSPFGGDGARVVHFAGEGYFDVAKDAEAPFEVHTGSMNIHVTGTRFNVSDYPEDSESFVTLIEGSVAVSSQQAPERVMTLAPNQRAVLSKEDDSLSLSQTSARQSIEWTNGYLFFDDRLLTDIANSLERRYDVSVVFASEDIKQLRFYGNFTHPGQTLDDILDALAATGRISYTRSGSLVQLR